MGYIKSMYGNQDPQFIRGFLAAIDTYAVYIDGKRYIGSPEKKLKKNWLAHVKNSAAIHPNMCINYMCINSNQIERVKNV